jgi:hypothetical protein
LRGEIRSGHHVQVDLAEEGLSFRSMERRDDAPAEEPAKSGT